MLTRSTIQPRWSLWALPVLFALAAAAPLVIDPGFLNTRQAGDSPFLLFRLHQLSAALADGVFPVRWMPDAAFGLGYPFFHYYAALPYYLAALFHALGASFVLSLKLAVVAGAIVASGGMFGWVRAITGRRSAGLLAAGAYTFAPYHLVNVYLRGDSLAEFWAMSWYPLILWALVRAAERPTRRRLAAVGLSYGALVLTHNISALLFSPFVALYALACVAGAPHHVALPATDSRPARSIRLRRAALLGVAGALGLALAAWFWVPALADQDAVQLGDQTSGYFFYGGHFRGSDLVQDTLAFDYDVFSPQANPFSMGLAQAIGIALGAVALIARMIRRRAWLRDGAILAGLALSTWMITPGSEPVWANLPLLEYTQFPWRFLSVQAVFGAAATAALVDVDAILRRLFLHDRHNAHRSISLAVALLVAAALGVAGLWSLETDFIRVTDQDVTPQRLMWYEAFSNNIGTTVRHEYLPAQTQPRPYTSDILLGREPRAKFLSGAGSARRIEAGAASQEWAITVTGESAQVALPLLYWPGWRAAIDGRAVELTALEGPGYVQLTVPQGAHTVRLWLGRTPLRLSMELLSLGAAAIALALLRPGRSWPGRGVLLVMVGGAVAIVAAIQLWPERRASDALLHADFDLRPYFQAAPNGVPFTDGTRLLNASTNVTGDVFGYRLAWHAGPEPVASLALVPGPQQTFLHAPEYPVATAKPLDPTITGSYVVDHVTPGLYFPRVTLAPTANAAPNTLRARAAADRERGALHLAPVIVPPTSGAPGEIRYRDETVIGPLLLRGLTTQHTGDRLTLTLWWETLREAPLNYGIDFALLDADGNEWLRFNAIAGGGGQYPTALWSPGEIVPDAYTVTLPRGIPAGAYRLRAALYDPLTLVPVGEATIEDVIQPVASPFPCGVEPRHVLYREMAFEAVTAAPEVTQGEALPVTVEWTTTAPPAQNYALRWALRQDGATIWQAETPLAPGAPGHAWTPSSGCGTFAVARHRLPIPDDLPGGEYRLAFQIIDEDGAALAVPYTIGPVTVIARDRQFDVPALDTALQADFGGQIRLWGYSLDQGPDALALRVAWGALDDLDADYKLFVHLYPADNLAAVAAQIDTMPRDYAYPTSLWVAGEVVEDTLTLDLRDLPPGEYALALGWTALPTADRLDIDAPGAGALPDRRLILPDTITIR